MKGDIVCCLRDLVIEKFGREKWEESLTGAGLPKTQTFADLLDFEDEVVVKVVRSVCQTLDLSLEQAADAFGDYWVNVYSQKPPRAHYGKHTHPHKFDWSSAKKLIMNYQSRRGLVDFLVGLAQGVGNHYRERLEVAKLGPDRIEIAFN